MKPSSSRADFHHFPFLFLLLSLLLLFPLPTSCLTLNEDSGLNATDGVEDDQFGRSVAIQGTIVVVGAPQHDFPGPPPIGYFNAGAAYIFNCSSIPCEEVSKLESTNKTLVALFGSSVAIDGSTIVVGAPRFGETLDFLQGAVFVFHCPTFTTCREESMLMALDPSHQARFGERVVFSEGTLVVGALDRDESIASKGAVYIFNCSDISSCNQESQIVILDERRLERFGERLALRGSLLAVGTPFVDLGLKPANDPLEGLTWMGQFSSLIAPPFPPAPK